MGRIFQSQRMFQRRSKGTFSTRKRRQFKFVQCAMCKLAAHLLLGDSLLSVGGPDIMEAWVSAWSASEISSSFVWVFVCGQGKVFKGTLSPTTVPPTPFAFVPLTWLPLHFCGLFCCQICIFKAVLQQKQQNNLLLFEF